MLLDLRGRRLFRGGDAVDQQVIRKVKKAIRQVVGEVPAPVVEVVAEKIHGPAVERVLSLEYEERFLAWIRVQVSQVQARLAEEDDEEALLLLL